MFIPGPAWGALELLTERGMNPADEAASVGTAREVSRARPGIYRAELFLVHSTQASSAL